MAETHSLIDRDTVFGMIGGVVLGARGYSFWPAIGLSLAVTAIGSAVPRDNPVGIPVRSQQTTGMRLAVDTLTTMAAWWIGHVFFPAPKQLTANVSTET